MSTPFYAKTSPVLSSLNTITTIPSMTLKDTVSDSDKKKTLRCNADGCRHKLGLLGFDCKCGGKYCGSHRWPEEHKCGHNHKAEAKAELEKRLVECRADKLSGDRV